MSPIADRIEVIVRDGLAPVLRAEGYRKSGRTWRRADAEAICITNLQGSRTNAGEEGTFTLNLGIYFPGPDVLKRGPPSEGKPLESHCIVHERIGMLMPVRRDFWWEVRHATDLRRLGEEVAATWLELGKPWLDTHRNPAVAQEWLVEHRKLPFWAAVFAVYRGRLDEAQQLLERAVAEAGPKSDIVRWHRDWARKHRLIEPTSSAPG